MSEPIRMSMTTRKNWLIDANVFLGGGDMADSSGAEEADGRRTRPLVSIQSAEENHVTPLAGRLDRHGIDVPPNE